ncbi:hypothetical protein KPB2_5535 [Klebsiella pneumoniae Kb677]|nr:hypothetical protein KPB2_5535 [Klebsiella pneumoniae Kb677]
MVSYNAGQRPYMESCLGPAIYVIDHATRRYLVKTQTPAAKGAIDIALQETTVDPRPGSPLCRLTPTLMAARGRKAVRVSSPGGLLRTTIPEPVILTAGRL